MVPPRLSSSTCSRSWIGADCCVSTFIKERVSWLGTSLLTLVSPCIQIWRSNLKLLWFSYNFHFIDGGLNKPKKSLPMWYHAWGFYISSGLSSINLQFIRWQSGQNCILHTYRNWHKPLHHECSVPIKFRIRDKIQQAEFYFLSLYLSCIDRGIYGLDELK